MLIIFGQYCRLENIGENGHWLENATFKVADKEIQHVVGQSAGTLMLNWRRLRTEHPNAFAGLYVWQQPCAMIDSVLWRWQGLLEAKEFRQVVRITDCLTAAWTDSSKEAAFLLQQIGCPVAPWLHSSAAAHRHPLRKTCQGCCQAGAGKLETTHEAGRTSPRGACLIQDWDEGHPAGGWLHASSHGRDQRREGHWLAGLQRDRLAVLSS